MGVCWKVGLPIWGSKVGQYVCRQVPKKWLCSNLILFNVWCQSIKIADIYCSSKKSAAISKLGVNFGWKSDLNVIINPKDGNNRQHSESSLGKEDHPRFPIWKTAIDPCPSLWQRQVVIEYGVKCMMSRWNIFCTAPKWCPMSISESSNLADHDFIGACECSLGEVVATQGLGITR